jgi:glycosyltransferase involved in cell wall biosynthesis
VFVRALAPYCERLVVTGRLDPSPGRYPYKMTGVEYAPLPHYESGAHLLGVLRSLPASIARFWRLLDETDVVWLLGPNPPQVLAFALVTKLRRRRLVLGVRQNLPELIRHRYPGRKLLAWFALALEGAFRALALRTPVVVVGPDLARRYRRAPHVHVAYVSLLAEDDIVAPEDDHRDYGGELRMLSVGRLDPEKNPLLLADVLARAVASEPRWTIDVCGEGTLETELRRRMRDLGVEQRARFHGYVPIDDGLWDLYRDSHLLLHVSFTEGVPQVLLEAFAARLPVVATDVGGVAALARDRALLVPPADAEAAAAAVNRLAGDPALRAELVARAVDTVRAHTIDAECGRLAAFLGAGDGSGRFMPP